MLPKQQSLTANHTILRACDMTKQDHISRVWDIIENARIGVLTTRFACGLRARPLEARADRDAGII